MTELADVSRLTVVSLVLVALAVPARAQQSTQGLNLRYARESEEYAALARQVYRQASGAVTAGARGLRAGGWAVVLDIDETTLDNSQYQAERAAASLPFTHESWERWTLMHAAPAVPGVADFIAGVRRLHGHIAWITDRDTEAREPTRTNLRQLGLWSDDDRLCVLERREYVKAVRRSEVRTGQGSCAWAGQPQRVLAYIGDQVKHFPADSTADFPAAGENDPDAGRDSAFGRRFFLMPNALYGAWANGVTRRDRLDGPPLVVAIVVDQMRADYLDRFASQLTGGLARMVREGAVFTRAYQDHAMSETAPGHASILSGRWPNSTGIVRNNEGVNDSTPLLEVRGEGASPLRFRGTALYDWMLARYPGARVLSISRKDRGAILPVGRARGNVFWYQAGIFTTSRYYMDALPSWLRAFNAEAVAARAPGRVWDLLLPASQYPEADSMLFENGGRDLVFPHVLPADTVGAMRAFVASPAMDSVTLALALRGVDLLGLGRGDGPDLLSVGLSTTDYVGHAWGPDSREIHDQILRLDRYLGSFFDSLSRLVPAQRIVVVLTADHGVTSYPEYSNMHGDPAAQVVNVAGLIRGYSAAIEARTGVHDGIRYFDAGLLVMNRAALAASGLNVDSVVTRIGDEMRALTAVQRVDTPASLARADTATDDVARQWIHLVPPDLHPDLFVSLKPHMVWGAGYAQHGQPSEDDTHVPLLFWGPAVRPGRYDQRVGVVDIAPTLARVLGIPADSAVQGRALGEALLPAAR